jgi:hypothetical protein
VACTLDAAHTGVEQSTPVQKQPVQRSLREMPPLAGPPSNQANQLPDDVSKFIGACEQMTEEEAIRLINEKGELPLSGTNQY